MRALVLALLFAALSAQADEFILIPAAGGGGGAAPVLASSAGGPRAVSGTSMAHTLAAGLASGDRHLLLTGVTSDVSASIVCPGTAEYNRNASIATNQTAQFCDKTSSGSDSNTVSWTGSDGSNGISLRITGATTTAVSTPATASSTTPDCPSVSFTAPALLICACAGADETDNLSAAIGGSWSQVLHQDGGSNSAAPWVHVEQCTANSGTDCDSGNPPSFTMATSSAWVCRTIVYED